METSWFLRACIFHTFPSSRKSVPYFIRLVYVFFKRWTPDGWKGARKQFSLVIHTVVLLKPAVFLSKGQEQVAGRGVLVTVCERVLWGHKTWERLEQGSHGCMRTLTGTHYRRRWCMDCNPILSIPGSNGVEMTRSLNGETSRILGVVPSVIFTWTIFSIKVLYI